MSPIYDFKCPDCGVIPNVWAKMDESYTKCPKCGILTQRLISPANVSPDMKPYLDPNLGHEPVYVESRQHRKRLMKERGLSEIG